MYRLAILMLLILPACKTTDPNNLNLDELKEVVKMSKSPCFGKCKIYSVTLYNNGVASFEGKANVEYIGSFVKKTDQAWFQKVKQYLETLEPNDMQAEYKGGAMDVQTTTFSFYEGGNQKVIKGDFSMPPELQVLSKILEDMAMEKEGWMTPDGQAASEVKNNTIYSEIITEFNPTVDVQAWIKAFPEYQFEIVKRVSPNLPIYVLTYDQSQKEPESMLHFMKNNKDVKQANFNKKLSNRGGRQ